MSFDLYDVVGRMATATLVLTRHGEDTFDAQGRPVVGVPTMVGVTALYYPATPKELLRLPEGERTDARLVLWTSSIIRERDEFEADNARWQVEAVAYTALTNTFKALARQVTP